MNCKVLVIGGGPAGLAAAIEAKKHGASVALIEREGRLGGILKQCIHDGFGLLRFGEKLTGPEYAARFIDEFRSLDIPCLTLTFVTEIVKTEGGFTVTVVNREGISDIETKTIVLATGCRERTSKQVSIHGTRPSGIFTAGTAQNLVNLLGLLPTKRCVILGSGDIGLIMARRLTLEGAAVEGVYEAKPSPSGLRRNIYQCLDDFGIPLYLSKTVTRVFGEDRLSAVEISDVDDKMRPIKGTERRIDCDALILSVGLIPENELAETLGVSIDPKTKGPVCDGALQTTVDGVFSCGNALHVSDLADYVSESGEMAGAGAAQYAQRERRLLHFDVSGDFLYVVPQCIDLNRAGRTTVYFRSREELKNRTLLIQSGGETLLKKKYPFLRPPEMERIEIDFAEYDPNEHSDIRFALE